MEIFVLFGLGLLLGAVVAIVGYRIKNNALLIGGSVVGGIAVAFFAFALFVLVVCWSGNGCI